MLSKIRIHQFRCFQDLNYNPIPGLNFITGKNAQGKTSILEAACMLLRLKSPRTSNPEELIRFGGSSYALEGMVGETRLFQTCTPPARVLKLDSVAQSSSTEYLSKGRIVWFGNEDLGLVNGSAERRRKLLDSAGLQLPGSYGKNLKAYDRALRSRNLLLREGRPRQEIEAYNIPLAAAGDSIISARAALVESLSPLAAAACRAISGEDLQLFYAPGAEGPLLEALASSREEESRVRMTRVGPQRDEVELALNGIPAGAFASEGQRRTVAVALKLAVAALLEMETGAPPLLLLDDIFGELDPSRRDALLLGIPSGSQAFITTADLTGITLPENSRVDRLCGGILSTA